MASTITTETAARAAGYVLPMFADSDFNSVDILIREGTDLDDAFKAYVPDWNEVVRFNGWMWCFDAVPDCNALEA